MISLIIPSRERRPLLENCIRSFTEKASKKENYEFVIIFDNDDCSYFKIENFIEQLNVNYTILRREQSNFINAHYQNWAAAKSNGTLLFHLNDDTVCQTTNWDQILLDIEEKNKDKSFYIRIYDDHYKYGNHACCFPIVSKRFFNILNQTFPHQIAAGGADSRLYEIIKLLNYNIIIDCPEVKIDHISYHNGSRSYDKTNGLICKRGTTFRGELSFLELNWYILQYNEAISQEQEIFTNDYSI